MVYGLHPQVKPADAGRPVGGVFACGGGPESEVWSDAKVLQAAYHRGESFQSVYVRLAFNNFHAATMNWPRFSLVAFAFAVTPSLLQQGIVWATAIGLVGGLLPALRAARLPIAAALREL